MIESFRAAGHADLPARRSSICVHDEACTGEPERAICAFAREVVDATEKRDASPRIAGSVKPGELCALA